MKEPRLTIDQLRGDFRKLAEAVGIEAAMTISRLFGGLTIAIPRLAALGREERNFRIRAEYDSGTPARRLALRNGLTVRQIFNILSQSGGEHA